MFCFGLGIPTLIGFFAVFGGIKMLHEQPGGKVEASDCDDSMTFKVFTSTSVQNRVFRNAKGLRIW